jgi:CheY-like chemotaxis protein
MSLLLSATVTSDRDKKSGAEAKDNTGIASAQGSGLAGIERAKPLGRVPVRLKGLQILVIEDAPDVLDVLITLLRFEGADVAGAGSGHEALKVFRSRHFDVVVSDLGLPDIAGDVLIRTIIAAARRPIQVVVITGESQPFLTRALEAGAGVIFAKPCQWGSVVTYLDGLGLAPAA